MAFDTFLATRIATLLVSLKDLEQKKMFGGLCFMYRGNMLCGVEGDRLMLRVGADKYESTLRLKNASKMEFTGRPLKGFVFVSPAGIKTDAALRKWLDLGINFSKTLPAKESNSGIQRGGKRNRLSGATRLSELKNFGPVTLREFESMGFSTLGQLEKAGFEGICRKYVRYYPERLNANAFLGVVCAIEHTVWTKATPNQRHQARRMAAQLRREFGVKKSR